MSSVYPEQDLAFAQPSRAEHGASPSLALRLAQAGFALPLLLLAGWLVWDYPVGGPWLALLLLLLAVAQWLQPTAWLILLPALMPVLELPPWSGRLLLDEYDAVLALLAAVALLRGDYGGGARQVMRRSYLPLWLLGLSVAVGLARGLLPLAPLDANAWSGYLSHWNALRVGKGFLWALVYAPLVTAQLARERSRVEQDFTLGMTAGALLFGLVVLWERGFFLDLMTARNIWGLVDTWLDLAARYRITGLFSQMHLGGAAVDGFIVLIWPFALLLLLKARHPALIAVAAAALALIAYACLVTFTRTTYLAVAVAGIVGLLPVLRGADRRQLLALLALLLFTLVMGAGSLIGFRLGGVLVLMAISGVIGGAVALAYLSPHLPERLAPVAFGLVLLGGFVLALRGIVTSKYGDTSLFLALVASAGLAALAGVGSWYLGQFGRRFPPRIVLGLGFAVAVLLPMIAMGLGGARMEVRMASLAQDWETRVQHWRGVLAASSGEPASMIFGQGMGRYPAMYLSGPRGDAEGSYVWGDGTLRLTDSGSLHMGQRLTGWSPQPVQVQVRYRVLSGAPRLHFQLARRPLLVQEWFGAKIDASLRMRNADEGWQTATVELDGNRLKAPRWYDPSFTIFSFRNGGPDGSVIEIDAVRLVGINGHDLLRNGGFSSGGDHWLAYNDYDHLTWHAKSLPLIIWLDLGLLGLAAVVLFLIPAFVRLTRRAVRGERFPLALLTALSGFLVLGIATTLFDVPRLTFLFWLIATMALYRRRYRSGGQMARRGEYPDDAQLTAGNSVPAESAPRVRPRLE